MQIRVHVTADKTLKELGKLKRLLDNWRDELDDVGDYLEQFLREDVFETEGSIYRGQKWQELSYKYRLQKQGGKKGKKNEFAGRGILERTGRMRKAWDRQTDSRNLYIWNTTDYAIKHQKGQGVPKRAIIQELPSQQIRHIENMFKKAIIRKIEQAA